MSWYRFSQDMNRTGVFSKFNLANRGFDSELTKGSLHEKKTEIVWSFAKPGLNS